MPAAALPWWRRRSRRLAGQTAKATEEISSQIANMQLATEELVSAIKAIGQTIERISDIATSISAAVEQQRGATQNIAQSVRAAASGTADVAVNIRNAAQGADETGETSSRMFASAQALSGESLQSEGRGRKVPRPRPRGLTERHAATAAGETGSLRFVDSYTANDCPSFPGLEGCREPICRALSGDAVRPRPPGFSVPRRRRQGLLHLAGRQHAGRDQARAGDPVLSALCRRHRDLRQRRGRARPGNRRCSMARCSACFATRPST